MWSNAHAEPELHKFVPAAGAEHVADEFTCARVVSCRLRGDLFGFQDCSESPVMVGAVVVGASDIDPVPPQPLSRVVALGDRACGYQFAENRVNGRGPFDRGGSIKYLHGQRHRPDGDIAWAELQWLVTIARDLVSDALSALPAFPHCCRIAGTGRYERGLQFVTARQRGGIDALAGERTQHSQGFVDDVAGRVEFADPDEGSRVMPVR